MPKRYPKEFRGDVVRVARSRESGVTLEQIAAGFGVHPITLSKWLRRADTDEGARPATASGESAELREARKRIRTGGAQRFQSAFSGISPHFRPRRHLMTAVHYRAEMTVRFALRGQVTGVTGLSAAA